MPSGHYDSFSCRIAVLYLVAGEGLVNWFGMSHVGNSESMKIPLHAVVRHIEGDGSEEKEDGRDGSILYIEMLSLETLATWV